LAATVIKLNRYRFYAASLLFIYDGDKKVQEEYRNYLMSLEKKGDEVFLNGESQESETDVELDHNLTTSSKSRQGHHHRSHHKKHDHRKKKFPGSINIRLVDFANCSTGDDFLPPLPEELAEEEDVAESITGLRRATFPPTHPDQPDLGFILGLKSICAALKLVWNEQKRKKDEGLLEGVWLGAESLEGIEGEDVWDKIFGEGASAQKFGEGPSDQEIWDLVTA
jgi:hypothetical protein